MVAPGWKYIVRTASFKVGIFKRSKFNLKCPYRFCSSIRSVTSEENIELKRFRLMVAPGWKYIVRTASLTVGIFKRSIRTLTCMRSVTHKEIIELKWFRLMVAPGWKYIVRTASLKVGIFKRSIRTRTCMTSETSNIELKRFRFMVRTASLKSRIF